MGKVYIVLETKMQQKESEMQHKESKKCKRETQAVGYAIKGYWIKERKKIKVNGVEK